MRRRYKERIFLRQEHLTVDYKSLLKHLHISANPAEIPHAKQGSSGMGYQAKKMFTRAQLDGINAAFAAEFQAHSYAMI